MADQDKTSSQRPGEEREAERSEASSREARADQGPDRGPDRGPDQGIGTPEEAFKAATHGTDEAPHTHPAHAEHAIEHPGRHADDSWKKNHQPAE